MKQNQSDLSITIDQAREQLGLNYPGLSKKVNIVTLNKISELIIQYLCSQQLIDQSKNCDHSYENFLDQNKDAKDSLFESYNNKSKMSNQDSSRFMTG